MEMSGVVILDDDAEGTLDVLDRGRAGDPEDRVVVILSPQCRVRHADGMRAPVRDRMQLGPSRTGPVLAAPRDPPVCDLVQLKWGCTARIYAMDSPARLVSLARNTGERRP